MKGTKRHICDHQTLPPFMREGCGA